MIISVHAVRRYKQRIGNRSSSKKKVIKKIQSELKKGSRWYNHDNGYLYVHTENFTAMCKNNVVITILFKNGYQKKKDEINERLSMF